MINRIQIAIAVSVIGVLCSLGISEAEAQDRSPNSAMLRFATRGVGTSATVEMMTPLASPLVTELIQRHAWPPLERQVWPMDDEGRPFVETRREDERWHRIGPGEGLARLREMYRVTTSQLQTLNPDLDLQSLEVGQEVLIWRRVNGRVSESRGRPQSGRLLYSEPLPLSDRYKVLFPYRTFGTYYTVSEIVRVLDGYYETFPQAAPLMVGDLSLRTGRRLNPHNSHQSGRDVDITLPRIEEPPDYNRFHHVRRDNLDVEKALWLLLTALEEGYVQYIFLDWYHQRSLYRLAREQGAPEEWLREVFQYPYRGGSGIVRHARGHRGHFHIRYHCQPTDRWCG